VGAYGLSAFGTAHEGQLTSSFNAAGGTADTLDAPAPSLFGMGDMILELPRQVHTRALGERFAGEVVLTPQAVGDLLTWLLGQLGDTQLIAGSSLYRQQVGQAIASPRLGLRSRPDGPGTSPVSADAHVAAAVTVIDGGRLCTLLPSLYGARKTGLPHVPVADGWAMDAGDTPRDRLADGLSRGAWVGRLSMGMPASNGDFSGVIKNSFLVQDGRIGDALTETMITGNVAQMLRDIVAVSAERLDTGETCLPWLRIGGLHFS
jgi:PmbA protein